MTVGIVAFSPDRLPAMAELWVEAWADSYPAIDFETRRAWFCDRIAAMAESGTTVLVALRSGELAGFVTIDEATGWIDQMLVGRAHQGTGVAAMLMDAAKRRRLAGLSLDVNADNLRAIAFYRQQGFVTTGRRVSDQGRAIDLMAWRPLPPGEPPPT
ncbi:MAG: putative acetyltransferase [Xanthobacteraceae bacterium]|nr:MAG: putative acetyltransferase [Xanthobacteraceae bacterium]